MCIEAVFELKHLVDTNMQYNTNYSKSLCISHPFLCKKLTLNLGCGLYTGFQSNLVEFDVQDLVYIVVYSRNASMPSKSCTSFGERMVHWTLRDMNIVKHSANYKQRWLYWNRSWETKNRWSSLKSLSPEKLSAVCWLLKFEIGQKGRTFHCGIVYCSRYVTVPPRNSWHLHFRVCN